MSKHEHFWSIVKLYNKLMKSSIVGPDCLTACKGDCCSIKIDVPKILAKEYIKRGYAHKTDFIRSNIFSFQLRFDESSSKCFLYNKELNGCSIHNSGIKPPQCWIYPTGFSNTDKDISCKRASGWKIINQEKAGKAEKLLEKYNFLCQMEAKREVKRVNRRVGKERTKNSKEDIKILKKKLMELAPSQLGGFKDGWDFFDVLPAEGMSLQMKKFCIKFNKQCRYPKENFFECANICNTIAEKLIDFIQDNILDYIKMNEPDSDGEYPFIKLFEFVMNQKKSHSKIVI